MNDTKYLLLRAQKGKSFKPIHKELKELDAFYTGIGYAVPQKNESLLKQLVDGLPNVKIQPVPLGEGQTFESYKQSHNAAYFQELLIKIDEKLILLRESLNLNDIDEESVSAATNLTNHEKEELSNLLYEKNELQGRIKWAHGLEKTLKKRDSSTVSFDAQLEQEKQETAETFLSNHRETFSSGVLLAGYGEMDKQLFYVPGDLVIVQGMSNHGKTKWMEQKAYNFLTNSKNVEKNPVCVFISFENSPLFVKQDFFNMISKHKDAGARFIAFDPSYVVKGEESSPFLYPSLITFQNTVATYEQWKKNQSLIFLENVQFENLQELVAKLKEMCQGRPIAIFLDYIQIIPNSVDSDGWERIKEISYGLERIAQQNKVVIIAGSQVNEKRETREGKDVYNAATIVEDVFNHSHSALKLNDSPRLKYIEQIDKKNVVSITITKYKRGSSFSLNEAFLFDGYGFEEIVTNQPVPPVKKNHLPNENKNASYEDLFK